MFLIKNQDGQYLASKPAEPITKATRLTWLTYAREACRFSTLEDAVRFATNVGCLMVQVVPAEHAIRDDALTYRNAPAPSQESWWPPREIEVMTAGWPHVRWTKASNRSIVVEPDPWEA